MAELTEAEKKAAKEIWANIFISPPIDGFVLMLCLGGIAHQLGYPNLALSYRTCLLIIVASIAVFPQTMRCSAYLKQLMIREAEKDEH